MIKNLIQMLAMFVILFLIYFAFRAIHMKRSYERSRCPIAISSIVSAIDRYTQHEGSKKGFSLTIDAVCAYMYNVEHSYCSKLITENANRGCKEGTLKIHIRNNKSFEITAKPRTNEDCSYCFTELNSSTLPYHNDAYVTCNKTPVCKHKK